MTHPSLTQPTAAGRCPSPDRRLRLGLCCLFVGEPLSFRTTTATRLLSLPPRQRLATVSAICLHNARTLVAAIQTCHRLGIGAFRITSPLFPRMTHPHVGYRLEQLPDAAGISMAMDEARTSASRMGIRLSFHPDQFVVLSSPRAEVVENSLRELSYHGFLAELVGADTINLHAGGVYGDKGAALRRLRDRIGELPDPVRTRLTLENDDVSHTPADLIPLCEETGIPFVYDVHHHRCNPDALDVETATRACIRSWERLGREPYCHLSSPRNGWGGGDPKPHADYVDPADFPPLWKGIAMTVDVEAKAKEKAVLKLAQDLFGSD